MSIKSLALVCCLAVAPAPPAERSELFEFQSAFWMNLHHFLHALARPGAPLVQSLPPDATPDERARWDSAVETYRIQYGKRSLLFDQELVKTKLELAAAGSAESLASVRIPDEHRAVLQSVAPIYRKHFWPAHDADNKKFVAMLEPLLKQYGAGISSRLAASYDETWPLRPVRVDLVRDAGPPGNAYTTNDPTHITIGVTDARHQGVASLEIVFHEASHGWDQKLIDGVEQAAKRLNVPADQRLWHALLFFNAGKIVGDALAAGGVRDYAMYMEKEGMFDRLYRGWREPIAKHWTAFLAGKLSRDRAIELILKRE